MKKNKKGFTLIELLAVIVILIIVILLAVSRVRKTSKDTRNNAIKANAISFLRSVDSLIDDHAETYEYQNTYLSVKDLFKNGISMSGTKPDGGFVVINNYEIYDACLEYGSYRIRYNNQKYKNPKKGSCSGLLSFAFDFDYTGGEKEFIAPYDGYYKLETWGAQGGDATSYNGAEVLLGGYGGYSTAEIYLSKDDKLYVNVGGTGVDNYVSNGTSLLVSGGYNGGGTAIGFSQASEVNNVISGSGGGATHIAFKPGVLSSLADSLDSIIIVAGGGGGATSHRYNDGTNVWRGTGGAGGGFQSVVGKEFGRNNTGTPATQTTGGCGYDGTRTYKCGSFGKGADADTGSASGGGGGGLYGGGIAIHGGSSGGSGYIGHLDLFNKIMYCYNCTASDVVSTRTKSTDKFSDKPKANTAKEGNGYARISYVGDTVESEANTYAFTQGSRTQTFSVPRDGIYKLEVWGGQGGEAIGRRGGYGGYSYGEVSLKDGDILYINVGGKGEDSPSATYLLHKGGYNGGGDSRSDGATGFAAGGGATSISTTKTLLKDTDISNLLIVAGGGGGGGTYAGYDNFGGNAGGFTGNVGGGSCAGAPGTQISGGLGCASNSQGNGSYGQGANTTGTSSGGGGGFFGGGTGYNSGSGGGGGSGYIASPKLSAKGMYCYNCTESADEDTKTTSNTCVEATPTKNCSKIGAGYAKITYLRAK